MFQDRPERNSPEYKSFRFGVLSRDEFTCQQCKGKQNLEVHHIIRWADCHGRLSVLRFARSNGITLCKSCHDLVTGREEQFKETFRKIVDLKTEKRFGPKKKNRTKKAKSRRKYRYLIKCLRDPKNRIG